MILAFDLDSIKNVVGFKRAIPRVQGAWSVRIYKNMRLFNGSETLIG